MRPPFRPTVVRTAVLAAAQPRPAHDELAQAVRALGHALARRAVRDAWLRRVVGAAMSLALACTLGGLGLRGCAAWLADALGAFALPVACVLGATAMRGVERVTSRRAVRRLPPNVRRARRGE